MAVPFAIHDVMHSPTSPGATGHRRLDARHPERALPRAAHSDSGIGPGPFGAREGVPPAPFYVWQRRPAGGAARPATDPTPLHRLAGTAHLPERL
jgi:hypothetical protein